MDRGSPDVVGRKGWAKKKKYWFNIHGFNKLRLCFNERVDYRLILKINWIRKKEWREEKEISYFNVLFFYKRSEYYWD